VQASPNISSITGIATYDYRAAGSEDGFTLDLKDESGADLGQITYRMVLPQWPTSEWTILGAYTSGGEVLAGQTQHWRTLGLDSTQVETIHEVGDARVHLWVRFDGDFNVLRLVLGAPVTGLGTGAPDVVNTPNGLFRLIVVFENDTQIPDGEVLAFIEDTGIDAISSSPAFERLMLSANDEAWINAANVQARLCAAGVPGAQEQQQTGSLQQKNLSNVRPKAVECAPGPLERFAAVQTVLGHIGDGAGIADEVAGGASLTGSIARAVGSNMATAAVQAVADEVVSRNKRPIVGGLSRIGTAIITGGDSASENSAVVEFFAGGGGGGDADGGGSSGGGGGNTNGKSSGDPHLDTFDGLTYDFQGAGEFILVESSVDDFVVQARQEPTRGICDAVSLNSAVATRIDGRRLAFYASDEPIWMDGEPVELLEGQALLSDGSLIWESEDDYVVEWPTGDAMLVRRVGLSHLDVRFRMAPARRGNVAGLLGDFDQDKSNDIRFRDGTPIGQPVTWTELSTEYAQSWQISASESLLDYESGQDVNTFIIEGFPGALEDISDLPDEVRTAAEAICRSAGVAEGSPLEDCTLDVGCTDDERFVDSHTDRSPNEELKVETPIVLTDWTVEADPDRGVWTLAPDGLSVTQGTNGQPTFFVSPNDYFDVEIRGTWQAGSAGDDDFIGFVFGYESPLSANGDFEDDYQTFLLAWKGLTQDFGGFHAEEGLTLGYLHGTIPVSSITEVFWQQESSPLYTRIATSYGPDTGWERGVSYEFVLHYTPDGIRIEIDSETIFDLSPEEIPIPLVPGRFGFYNYSQPAVIYADFSAIN